MGVIVQKFDLDVKNQKWCGNQVVDYLWWVERNVVVVGEKDFVKAFSG